MSPQLHTFTSLSYVSFHLLYVNLYPAREDRVTTAPVIAELHRIENQPFARRTQLLIHAAEFQATIHFFILSYFLRLAQIRIFASLCVGELWHVYSPQY